MLASSSRKQNQHTLEARRQEEVADAISASRRIGLPMRVLAWEEITLGVKKFLPGV